MKRAWMVIIYPQRKNECIFLSLLQLMSPQSKLKMWSCHGCNDNLILHGEDWKCHAFHLKGDLYLQMIWAMSTKDLCSCHGGSDINCFSNQK